MKKLLISIVLSLLVTNSLLAQSNILSGKVSDIKQHAITYASIEVKSTGAIQMLQSTVSDAEGMYAFPAFVHGNYSITATAAGFIPQTKQVLVDSLHPLTTLPMFELAVAANDLKNVTVTAKKSFIEIKADKTVLNVENYIMASGSSAFDMIKKGPAISVDKEDNLHLKGGMAEIYIDGKPFYITGQQLTDYLKNLSADAISKIEIISNPGSRFEAAGTAGIINIKMKKNKTMGFNGNANIGIGEGRYPKVYGGSTLNYRKGIFNIFGNIDIGRYESFNLLNYNSTIGRDAGTVYQERQNFWHPTTKEGDYKIGTDISINKKSTLGFLINSNASSELAPTDNYTIFRNQYRLPTTYINSFKTDEEHTHNTAYNINFKTDIDSMGSQLNVDADYVKYTSSKEDVNYNYYLTNTKDTLRTPYIFRNKSAATVQIYSSKIDYTKYLKKSIRLEIGGKISFVNTDNNLLADSIDNKNWLIDNNRSNHFKYSENINAAYFTFNKEWMKWNMQAGLRAEQTNYTATSITINETDKKSYFNVFPTLFAFYKYNDKNTFSASYGRRIQRPSYQSLNPFINYIDPYTIFQGNPYLQPSLSDNFEVKHSFKNMLFTSLSYRRTNNASSSIVLQDSATKVTTNITQNIGYENYVGIDVTLSIPITKWWTSENNAGIYLQQSVSTYTGYQFNTTNTSANISSDNTFILPKNFKVQIGLYYLAPNTIGYTHLRCYYGGNLGIQKQLNHNRSTIKFSISNVGITAYRAHLQSDKLNIVWRNQSEGPKFRLTYSFKFGNVNVKASRQRKTASSEEKERVNL